MEYIDKDALRKALFNGEQNLYSWEEIEAKIDAIPAEAVAPVVRCKDCKWCHSGYCEKFDDLIPFGCADREWENWYCADGKRE